ncbi:CDP-glycerol glycerophosphotransferase family protein [Aliarcobacter trophiarum]|uniref:CDP-glycerol glycerophosphotransferase family protein n=1 Tax=Aliarcobacter trophiarum TaxID=708186 RepID=UPI00100C150B|nr:CDP-glycerol glycerophosphotransferase family protein [Aliarcobacter trophiarum]RXI28666.1 UDP-N-acetylglucosamine diphosphorylase [Aliarcobacter trophiarum]
MKSNIYQLQKKYINKILTKVKNKTTKKWGKQLIFKKMTLNHKKLLERLKNKEKIRVVFLVLYKTMWKVDTIFKKMQDDPLFEPIMLVCPDKSYGEEQMFKDMDETFQYFKDLKYNTFYSYKKEENRWLLLEELNPDIIFFTRPHNLTKEEYYEKAYLNYLTCYVPYHHEVGDYGDNISQYNQNFHNAMWKIFVSHACSKNTFEKYSVCKGKNVLDTGYPMMEELLIKKEAKNYTNIWKHKDYRIKIIFAPHHTIDSEELPYSNFLDYHEKFRELAIELKDKVIWSFKPHPLLRLKLNNHQYWGKEKTDEYFSFWQESEFSQLDEGDYVDLFLSSDAMIHDSGSFLAEYLYLQKPVIYMKRDKNNHFNQFGQDILKVINVAKNFDDIRNFVYKLIENKDNLINPNQNSFFNTKIGIYFKDKYPSDRIIENIKNSIKGLK